MPPHTAVMPDAPHTRTPRHRSADGPAGEDLLPEPVARTLTGLVPGTGPDRTAAPAPTPRWSPSPG